jgi:regulatory protein
MNSDGTLARVTYLPGVTPPAEDFGRELVQEEASSDASSDASNHASIEASNEAQAHRAQNVSMRALTRRGMSRWELGELLLSRELAPHIVEAELDRLEGVGLIDDVELADTIVRTQHERKGLGKSALVEQLRRRRIDQSAIDQAMMQLSSSDEVTRASELAERRARQLQGLDHDTAVRRLSGYLQRKGYSSETVRAAVVEALPRRSTGVRFR